MTDIPPPPYGHFDWKHRGEWIEDDPPKPGDPPKIPWEPGVPGNGRIPWTWMCHPETGQSAKVTEEAYEVAWKPLGWVRVGRPAD